MLQSLTLTFSSTSANHSAKAYENKQIKRIKKIISMLHRIRMRRFRIFRYETKQIKLFFASFRFISHLIFRFHFEDIQHGHAA
jgi:hypothetical protein